VRFCIIRTFLGGLQEICKRWLWKRASLSIGALLEDLEGGSFTGDSGRQIRALEMELLYGSSMRGTWREGSFTGNSESYGLSIPRDRLRT
jgi:hypothetical protein